MADEQPVDNIHRLFFRLDGGVVAYKGSNEKRRWMANKVENVRSVITRANKYYIIEAAIPWSALGFTTPPIEKLMRANVMLHDNHDGSNNVVYDMMPDAKRDASWTWIDFVLGTNPNATKVNVVEVTPKVSVVVGDTSISVSDNVAKTTVYTLAGSKVGEFSTTSFVKPTTKGVYLLNFALNNGKEVTRKISIK